jgi:hypothetical protein
MAAASVGSRIVHLFVSTTFASKARGMHADRDDLDDLGGGYG